MMQTNLNFVRNLRVGNKLLLLAVSFLLPISVLMYQLIEEKNSSITIADKELVGITCLTPLQQFQSAITKHSILYGEADGGGRAREAETAKKAAESALREALRINQPYIAEFGNSEAFTTLSKAWDTYASAPSVESAKQLHTAVRDAISSIGDKSNLLLLPDLDSYYLVDASLTSMPQIVDIVTQLTMITYQGSARGEIVHEDKERIAGRIQADKTQNGCIPDQKCRQRKDLCRKQSQSERDLESPSDATKFWQSPQPKPPGRLENVWRKQFPVRNPGRNRNKSRRYNKPWQGVEASGKDVPRRVAAI